MRKIKRGIHRTLDLGGRLALGGSQENIDLRPHGSWFLA